MKWMLDRRLLLKTVASERIVPISHRSQELLTSNLRVEDLMIRSRRCITSSLLGSGTVANMELKIHSIEYKYLLARRAY